MKQKEGGFCSAKLASLAISVLLGYLIFRDTPGGSTANITVPSSTSILDISASSAASTLLGTSSSLLASTTDTISSFTSSSLSSSSTKTTTTTDERWEVPHVAIDPKKKKRFMVVMGTRPEAVKMAPVIMELQKYEKDVETLVISTGQHQQMLLQVLEHTFGLQMHANLNVLKPGMTLDQVQARVLERVTPLMQQTQPITAVLVQGDTTTAMAAAMAAFYLEIPVVHIEAGLRTYNLQHPFPEEANRRWIDVVANTYYAPTVISCSNLISERVPRENIIVTGNTVVDALLWTANQTPSEDTKQILAKVFGSSGEETSLKTILVTLHRRENWELLPSIFEGLKQLASDIPSIQLVFPVHLNPKVHDTAHSILEGVSDRIKLLDPLSYEAIVHVMKDAYLLITDSGGLQEEASAFGVPVLLAREATERPEGVLAGVVRVAGSDAQKLVTLAKEILTDSGVYEQMAQKKLPFGDGKSSERIVKHMLGIGGGSVDEFTSTATMDMRKHTSPVTCKPNDSNIVLDDSTVRVPPKTDPSIAAVAAATDPQQQQQDIPAHTDSTDAANNQEGDTPLISILLPVYNGMPELQESVESTLNQNTTHSFEFIIINDASKDNTGDYLQTLINDPRIRIINNNLNKGLPATLNVGYRAARGKYITWTSADNIFYPDFLDTLVAALEEFPEAKFTYAVTEMFGTIKGPLKTFMGRPVDVLTRWNGLPAFMWHRDAASTVGYYAEDSTGTEDWDYWLRMLEKYPAAPFIDKTIFKYRRSEKQLYAQLNKDNKLITAQNTLAKNAIARHNGLLDATILYPETKLCANKTRCVAIAWWKLGTALVSAKQEGVRMIYQDVPYYAQAYEVDPSFVPGALSYARALAMQGKQEGAQAVLQHIASLPDLQEPSAKSMYGELQAAVMAKKGVSGIKNPCKAGPGADDFSEKYSQWIDVYKTVPKPTGKHRPYRLAVIPSDPLLTYIKKGRAHTLQDYYNPLGFFDEVYLLSPRETEKRVDFGMTIIPTTQKELSNRIEALDIHVVRAYGGYWACDFAEAGRVDRIPVICSVHDTNTKLLYEGLQKKVDYVFTMSQAVSDAVMAHGVPARKIFGFTNRIDMQHIFKPADVSNDVVAKRVQELKDMYPSKKYRILHIGRKAEQKNADTVAKAIFALGPNYVGIFIGAGNEKPLKELSTSLGIQDRVYLVQSAENTDMPLYHAMADVQVNPSRWEGFGIGLVEGMACGQVVVTSDMGPMNEFIQDGVSGILVKEYEDPDALAASIKKAVEDEETRSKILANGRQAAFPFDKDPVDRWEVQLYRIALMEAFKRRGLLER